jgi:hypothetical protein
MRGNRKGMWERNVGRECGKGKWERKVGKESGKERWERNERRIRKKCQIKYYLGDHIIIHPWGDQFRFDGKDQSGSTVTLLLL